MYGLAMVVHCCAVSCVAWLDDVNQRQSQISRV